jgi:hypothetical protein
LQQQYQFAEQRPTKAPLIAHIPMWIFHGVLDGAVDPMHSQDMLKALSKEGAHPGLPNILKWDISPDCSIQRPYDDGLVIQATKVSSIINIKLLILCCVT